MDRVRAAIDSLGNLPDSLLVNRSGLYRSAPLDASEQPDFVNAVAGLLTRLPARKLLQSLHEIEKLQGRRRDGERWGPRTIDLDLLAYGRQAVDEDGLMVPHPGIGERNFVLLPWREIAPSYMVPGLAEVASLAARISTTEPRIERIE